MYETVWYNDFIEDEIVDMYFTLDMLLTQRKLILYRLQTKKSVKEEKPE